MIKRGRAILLSLVKLLGLAGVAMGALLGYDYGKEYIEEMKLSQLEQEYENRALTVNPVIAQVRPLVRPKFTPIIAIGTSKKYFCSAFVISSNYALTAAHCVKDLKGNNRKSVRIFATDMKTEKVVLTNIDAKVVSSYMYAGLDMAAITGDFTEFDRLATVNSTKEIAGAESLSVGVLGNRIVMERLNLIQPYGFGILAAGQLFPGMSGGPVIDLTSGKVIGINSAMGEMGAIISPLQEWKHYLNLKDAND